MVVVFMNETVSKEIKKEFMEEYDKLKRKSDNETRGVLTLLCTAFILSLIFISIGGYITYKQYIKNNVVEKGD